MASKIGNVKEKDARYYKMASKKGNENAMIPNL